MNYKRETAINQKTVGKTIMLLPSKRLVMDLCISGPHTSSFISSALLQSQISHSLPLTSNSAGILNKLNPLATRCCLRALWNFAQVGPSGYLFVLLK